MAARNKQLNYEEQLKAILKEVDWLKKEVLHFTELYDEAEAIYNHLLGKQKRTKAEMDLFVLAQSLCAWVREYGSNAVKDHDDFKNNAEDEKRSLVVKLEKMTHEIKKLELIREQNEHDNEELQEKLAKAYETLKKISSSERGQLQKEVDQLKAANKTLSEKFERVQRYWKMCQDENDELRRKTTRTSEFDREMQSLRDQNEEMKREILKGIERQSQTLFFEKGERLSFLVEETRVIKKVEDYSMTKAVLLSRQHLFPIRVQQENDENESLRDKLRIQEEQNLSMIQQLEQMQQDGDHRENDINRLKKQTERLQQDIMARDMVLERLRSEIDVQNGRIAAKDEEMIVLTERLNSEIAEKNRRFQEHEYQKSSIINQLDRARADGVIKSEEIVDLQERLRRSYALNDIHEQRLHKKHQNLNEELGQREMELNALTVRISELEKNEKGMVRMADEMESAHYEIRQLREEAEKKRVEFEQQKKEMEDKMKTLSLQNKIELLGLEAMDLVETTDVVSKNAVVKNTQEMLRKVKGAKAEDETTFGNLLMWSGSYLADNYPMTPTAILFYVSAINWADSYFSGSECDLIYQIVRYLLLVISLGYLTLMGYRTSTAMNFSEFVRTFWVNWVVFILMIMTLMALPPVSCYGHVYTAIMNVVGVFGLLAMALTLHAVNGDRSRDDGYVGVEVEESEEQSDIDL